MPESRCLPHQTDRLFLTDGGLETWLMYKKGFELPHFCSFQLLDDTAGHEALRQYYREFALLARQQQAGYVFCSLTYRASRDWGQLLASDRFRPGPRAGRLGAQDPRAARQRILTLTWNAVPARPPGGG
jgi:S-methylmethionine-dependent homocysteine/selenocysteine methylase